MIFLIEPKQAVQCECLIYCKTNCPKDFAQPLYGIPW